MQCYTFPKREMCSSCSRTHFDAAVIMYSDELVCLCTALPIALVHTVAEFAFHTTGHIVCAERKYRCSYEDDPCGYDYVTYQTHFCTQCFQGGLHHALYNSFERKLPFLRRHINYFYIKARSHTFKGEMSRYYLPKLYELSYYRQQIPEENYPFVKVNRY